ncbi:MAG: cation:proton antiporter [Clostridia bacterium]|nr:cation:proton antiporter [Clostridia bacterium]
MEIIFTLAIALFAGLLLSRLAKLVNLPAVTAYLIAGVLIGPYLLGQLGVHFADVSFHFGFSEADITGNKFELISNVALGFIAFSIGNEFRVSDLKKFGKQATIIGILQAVFTTLVVDGALIGLHFILGEDVFPLKSAIILGAIASATAPAATLMVVKQYKAHGPVTKTLLPVVALDDAVGLILFAISFGVAKSIGTVGGNVNPWQVVISVVVEPILEVLLSILLGALMGFVFQFIERFFHSRSKRLAVSVAFVLITVAISMIKFPIEFTDDVSLHVGFSSLLACMMLGTIFCNICDFSAELMDRLDRWTAPIYVLFFVISGAELKLSVFARWEFVVVGLVYILFRCLGKYFGARISSDISKADPNVRKFLGITLFPQAGVALGMANIVTEHFGDSDTTAEMVLNIVLFSVLVYEIVGPFLTKISLEKAGEIDKTKKTSNRIRHHDKTVPTTKI